jgi:hypothetical protein
MTASGYYPDEFRLIPEFRFKYYSREIDGNCNADNGQYAVAFPPVDY